MNILPLVSAFILLFAIGSYTFVHELRAALQEKRSYWGARKLQRQFLTQLSAQIYRDLPGKPVTKEEGGSKNKNPTFSSPRKQTPHPHEVSKFNLTSLTKKDDPVLRAAATTLIERIYALTNISCDPEEVLARIIKTVREHPEIVTFEMLLAELPPEETDLFYKLIRGTNTYTLFTSVGIPPLGDFFSLDPTTHKAPIHFGSASHPVLLACFGDALASTIIEHEKEKWEEKNIHTPLTKTELEALLIGHRKNPADYAEHLSFDRRKGGAKKLHLDEKDIHLSFTHP